MTRQKTKGWLLACACMLLIAACAMVGMPVTAQGPDENNPDPTKPVSPTVAPDAQVILATQPITGNTGITTTQTVTVTPVVTVTKLVTGATPGLPVLPVSPTQPVTPPTVPPVTARPITTVPPTSAPVPPSPVPPTPIPPTPVPPSQTPLPTSTRTATPTPTTTPTLPEQVLKTAQENMLLAGLGAGVVVVFVLFVVALFMAFRGGKKAPTVLAHAFLISMDTPSVTLPIAKENVTIGRAKDCDVQITDKMKLSNVDTISRYHARLVKRGERWVLIDGGAPGHPSANGVFVNDKRTRENYLNEGDVIRLGQVAFQFVTQLPQSKPAQGGTR